MSNGYQTLYQPVANQAAQNTGIPPALLSSVIQNESSWNPYALNKSGATGIAQFMPGTAKQYGVNAWDPVSSINGAAQYLSDLYKKYGNWTKALSVYGGDSTDAYANKVLSGIAPDQLAAIVGANTPKGTTAGAGFVASQSPTTVAGWLAYIFGGGLLGDVWTWGQGKMVVVLMFMGALLLIFLGGRTMFDQGKNFVVSSVGLK